jgi:FAD/FMN-containing dehydrogenase
MSLAEGGIVADLRALPEVVGDPARRLARGGGGATWAQVDRVTQAHGLATTGGRVSTTGVAGLTLGGGSGWLERRQGLACDALESVELVTADSSIVIASEEEHGVATGPIEEGEEVLAPLRAEGVEADLVAPSDRKSVV